MAGSAFWLSEGRPSMIRRFSSCREQQGGQKACGDGHGQGGWERRLLLIRCFGACSRPVGAGRRVCISKAAGLG